MANFYRMWLWNIRGCDRLEAIWGNSATISHLSHGFTPTNTCPTRNSNNECLGYAMFECHANFYFNWESFVDRDQQKTYLRYVAPKPWRWQISSRLLWTGSIINWFKTHSCFLINPRIANFVESNYSRGMT